MKPEILGLLADPLTKEPLGYRSLPGPGGNFDESLVNERTGKQYPIRNEIPVFVRSEEISGSNYRYQTLYDRLARFYDPAMSLYTRFQRTTEERGLREYLDELEIKSGNRVLEVSIGTGRNIRYLTRSACFFGLDISWGMLKQCQRNSANWQVETELFMGQAENLPFRDQAFDVVFHVGGINFFNDRRKAIQEMVRVAKPGSKFVVVDESEQVAKRFERTPVIGAFYGRRHQAIVAPVDLVPKGMLDVRVKPLANGDLYCLTFRKPG